MTQLKDLEDLMDCRQNFRKYRNVLQKCDLPCFPYFGILLRDCSFVDVGNENFTPDGFVNFEKIKMKGEIIRSFQRFQQTPYHFPVNTHLQYYLQNLSTFDEETLHEYSSQYERAIDI